MLKGAGAGTGYNKSVFAKNISNIIVNGDSANKILVDMYAKLSVVVQTINTLMHEFSIGNFYAVTNILTQATYNKLALNLATLAVPANKFPEYETIRASSTSALAGLYQSIIQYSEYVDIQAQLELAKSHEAILYDPVKLKEYIDKMNQRRQIFPESNVQTIAATLKPEYAAYIKQFGFPPGAVFDPDKLSFVLQQLGMR